MTNTRFCGNLPVTFFIKETAMAFKEYDTRPTFPDMEIQRA
jgi:hypothetical protein